jgi:hypothetical protein
MLWSQVRLQRCKNDPKRSPFDKIDESFFNHDSESFERHEHDRIFYKKSGLREITLKINLLLNLQMKYLGAYSVNNELLVVLHLRIVVILVGANYIACENQKSNPISSSSEW